MENFETRVIGNFKPSLLDEGIIRKEFHQFLWDHGLNPGYFNIRDPHFNHNIRNGYTGRDAIPFHKDDSGADITYIMWSNVYPTEVRFPDGSNLKVGNGDVILLKNREVRHRFPTAMPSDDYSRWFVRAVAW